MKRLLNYLSSVKYVGYYIALTGLCLSVMFSLVIYPKIAVPYHAVLDPDGYGALGHGLWMNGNLSYFPDNQPSVERGPIYPLFLASLLMITNGLWPYSVQVGQSVLFGLMCLMVFWMSKTLWGKNIAVLTSVLCVFHPFLIWYTSRIWIETLAIFLFTSLIAAVLYLSLRPNMSRSLLVGCILGINILSKGTFLPFIVIVPLLLGYLKDKKIRWQYILCIVLTALILIFPWSIRNRRLTGKFIPVHLLVGLNFQIGDGVVENYSKSPFSFSDLWDMGLEKRTSLQSSIPENLQRWEREVLSNDIFLKDSINRYLDNPLFLLKKMALNSFLYWTLGENKLKTIVISLLQVPLLVLFILSAFRILKQKGIRTIQFTHISLVLVYFMFHLPVVACARYSAVLIPTMLTYALGILKPVLNGKHESS